VFLVLLAKCCIISGVYECVDSTADLPRTLSNMTAWRWEPFEIMHKDWQVYYGLISCSLVLTVMRQMSIAVQKSYLLKCYIILHFSDISKIVSARFVLAVPHWPTKKQAG